jgi:predicted nucleotidyltransferase
MGLNIGFNEGDYILTVEGLFFAVKGSVHPDELVIGILRYVPDPSGDREIGDVAYRRVYDIRSTTEYLRKNYPRYINQILRIGVELQSVPVDRVISHFDPRARLTSILENPNSEVENVLTAFVEAISEFGSIPTTSIGVTGSLLIGAQNESSDIDINVYGHDDSQRAYKALVKIRETLGWVKPLEGSIFESVLQARWGDTRISLDRFSGIEARKVLHGLVYGREYFVRLLVPDDTLESRPVEKVTIKAKVTDTSRANFNPCVIGVRPVDEKIPWKIRELKSYRGKFTEQVNEGDMVEVRGALEEVHGPDGVYHRVMLGGKGDYLLPS